MMLRRTFLRTGTALAATLPLPASPGHPAQAQVPSPWFRKSPRVFLLDFQFPDPVDQGVPGMPRFFRNLDTGKILDQLAAVRSTVVIAHAKCSQGNAYYNSRVCHKHSELGTRDLMEEFSRLCRARGLNLLYYVALSWDRRAFTAHPERQARDARGQGIIYSNHNPLRPAGEERYLVCMNGPHRRYVRDILTELTGNYDFDGFWLDQFSWLVQFNPCYCGACQADYRSETGQALPTGSLASEEGRAYIRWRRALNTRILHELVDHIRSVNPKLTVTHNGSGLYPGSDWAFCDREDYVSQEFRHHEGHGNLSLMCRKNRALKPEAPFEVEVWRFAMGPPGTARAYQTRPTAALLTEMAAAVALGGFPQYYDQMRSDGTLEKRSLDSLEPAFREVMARQAWGGRGELVPYALILWSKATEAHLSVDEPPLLEPRTLHADGLEGAHHALMESHIPLDVITERDLSRQRWRGARVMVLPDAECLASSCLAGLEAFVRGGGGLVVTGRSSLRDEDGKMRDNFALADLLGVDYLGMTRHLYTFLTLEREHPLTAALPVGFPMSVFETLQVEVRPRAGVNTLGSIVKPMPGAYWGFPPDVRSSGVAALTVRDYGKGRVVYAGASLGALYKRFSHADTRRLMVNAVVWAAGGDPPVSAVAPETVEVIPWRDEARKQTIIHLLNRTGVGPAQGQGRVLHQTIPVHDVKLRVERRLAGSTASAQPGNRRLPVTWVGDQMWITLERVEAWETVVID